MTQKYRVVERVRFSEMEETLNRWCGETFRKKSHKDSGIQYYTLTTYTFVQAVPCGEYWVNIILEVHEREAS
jgi:hypothetical protein